MIQSTKVEIKRDHLVWSWDQVIDMAKRRLSKTIGRMSECGKIAGMSKTDLLNVRNIKLNFVGHTGLLSSRSLVRVEAGSPLQTPKNISSSPTNQSTIRCLFLPVFAYKNPLFSIVTAGKLRDERPP